MVAYCGIDRDNMSSKSFVTSSSKAHLPSGTTWSIWLLIVTLLELDRKPRRRLDHREPRVEIRGEVTLLSWRHASPRDSGTGRARTGRPCTDYRGSRPPATSRVRAPCGAGSGG